MGAGLGGGSSDAAAVLVALDSIFETGLGIEPLEEIAAILGSDVPFFVRGQPAICRGRGEIIQPFDVFEKLKLLLLKPPFAVETPWAYKAWAASRSLPGDPEDEQDLGWTRIFNALERPVFEKFLMLPVMKEWLRQQPEVRAAAMSGSGSTIFAVMREGESGRDLEERLTDSENPLNQSCAGAFEERRCAGARSGGAGELYSNRTARAGGIRAARQAGMSAAEGGSDDQGRRGQRGVG
jgi:4-diphosphocytidyl-2-C-methyl-D-erythritol kinase